MSEHHAAGAADNSTTSHTSADISRLDADPHGNAPSTDPSNAEHHNEQTSSANPSKPASQIYPSAPASQFSSHVPSASHSPAPPAGSSSDSREHHHHHHHYHHHDSDPNIQPSQPTIDDPSSEAGPSRPRDPTRRKSRKHSTRNRPSYKGPIADPNDPSLIAPGNNGRPFTLSAGAATDAAGLGKAYIQNTPDTSETRPLLSATPSTSAKATDNVGSNGNNGIIDTTGAMVPSGPQRPELIQYGSVYYYPLSRQPTETEAESQGKRMVLVAVVAVVVVLGVLALGSEVREHHGGGKGWHHHGGLSG